MAISPTPDERLIRLGAALDAAWAAELATYDAIRGVYAEEADTLAEAAFEASALIVKEIMTVPATTLAGLRVKARALSWLRGADLEPSARAKR